MGMFDSVMVPCPDCGERAEFQSKAGPCSLNEYTLQSAPPEVLADIDRQAVVCEQCGFPFHIRVTVMAQALRGGR